MPTAVASGVGVAVGSVVPGSLSVASGEGEASGSAHSGVSSPTKMQPPVRASSASAS